MTGTEDKDWQAALLAAHADWLGPRPPSLAVGDGWRNVVGELFDGIAAVLRASDPPPTFRIEDVKEKYASIRVDWWGALDENEDRAIEALVERAEARSERTCDVCGKPGAVRASRQGGTAWLATRCLDHADGFPHRVARMG